MRNSCWTRPTCLLVSSLALALWGATGVVAQEDAVGEAADLNLTMTELEVLLTGPNGEPVAGARVRPYAMRMVEIDGHGFWDERKFGLPKDYVSDAEGVANIRFPSSMEMELFGKLTTKLVTFEIRHTDYVQQVVHCELGPDLDKPLTSIDVQLKKGCEVELAAVGVNGARISEFGILMAGPYGADMWAATEGGGRRTSAVNDGSWQTMLIAPQNDGATLFSGLLPLRVRPNQAVRLRNVLLTPGSVLHGQLSDNVPRPVRHGSVITSTAPKPAGNSYAEQDPSLVWYASAAIEEDGSFTIASIPRSGKVQIIAICDDFVSKTTLPDAGPFVMGQLFEVSDGEMTVAVDMEPTAAVEFTIRRPDGSLLDSGKVSASPNQRFYLGGSTFVGQLANSMDGIKFQLLTADERSAAPRPPRQRDFPFSEQPIVDGVVTLRGLPVGAIGADRASLIHEEFTFPIVLGGNSGEVRYELKQGQTTKVEVTAVTHPQAAAAKVQQAEEVRDLQAVGGLLQKAIQALQDN